MWGQLLGRHRTTQPLARFLTDYSLPRCLLTRRVGDLFALVATDRERVLAQDTALVAVFRLLESLPRHPSDTLIANHRATRRYQRPRGLGPRSRVSQVPGTTARWNGVGRLHGIDFSHRLHIKDWA